jgi:hypothetical protein
MVFFAVREERLNEARQAARDGDDGEVQYWGAPRDEE